MSIDTVSTIGAQRLYKYALQPMGRERFIDNVTADQPDTPAYFTYDAVLNARERPTLEQALERGLRPLTLVRLLELVDDGAQLLDTRDSAVDTRDSAEFAGAHTRRGQRRPGRFVRNDSGPRRPVVLIADPGREVEAATRLGRIGFDNVAGYLAGGMQPLDHPPELVEGTRRVTAATLGELIASAPPLLLLDVRTEREWRVGRIDGAVNIPLSRLALQLARLPSAGPLVVYCATGYRSAIAGSLMRRAGRQGVTDLVGGIGAWESVGLPTAPTDL